MEQDRFYRLLGSPMFRFFDRIVDLFKLNIVILLFTALGLGVFGLYPAMFAATAILNETIEHKEDKIIPRFWKYYKQYFWRGNFLMLITAITAFDGYWLIFKMSTGIPMAASAVIYFLFCVTAMIVIFWNLYLPSIYVLYPGFTFGKGLLFAVVTAFTKWKLTFLLFLIAGAWLVITLLIPQIMMFISFSSLCWFIICMTKPRLRKDTMPLEAE